MRPAPQQQTASKRSLGLARFGVGLGILAIAGGGVTALVVTKPVPPKIAFTETPLAVRTLRATRVPIARQWEGFGSATAPHSADIAALVAGPIVERPDAINPGAWLHTGDLIAQIDPEDFQQRLERAKQQAASIEAQLTSVEVEEESSQVSLSLAEDAVMYTQREMQRARDAMARGAATENEIERILRDLTGVQREEQTLRERLTLIPARRLRLQADLAARRADIKLAQLDLDRTRVVAPFEGALQSIDVQVGERVNINEVCARIVDLRSIEVELRLPVSAVVTLTPGDGVLLRADNPSGQIWEGTIERIAPETDASTRTATVFVVYEQPADTWQDNLLLPGQFVVATISSGAPVPRLVIPRASVIADRVFLLDAQGRVEPRTITVAHHHEGLFPELLDGNTQWVVVESGLSPGETVILSNLEDLRAGLSVVAIDASQGATP